MAGQRVHLRIFMECSPVTDRLRFFTDEPGIEPLVVCAARLHSQEEIEAILRHYARQIRMTYPNLEFSFTLPNLYREFGRLRPSTVYPMLTTVNNSFPVAGPSIPWTTVDPSFQATIFNQLTGVADEPAPPPKPEVKFEVNLMEALVGWKGWGVSTKEGQKGLLVTSGGACVWLPDEAMKAKCRNNPNHVGVVFENCTCGFYATDKKEGAKGYGQVLGQVYGWDRYVRGSEGWRAEYAYPKMFLLKEDQVDLVDQLRAYHCPIYVEQPVLLYSPKEDGYEGEEDANR
jgi:hypothetical protein